MEVIGYLILQKYFNFQNEYISLIKLTKTYNVINVSVFTINTAKLLVKQDAQVEVCLLHYAH